MKAAVEYPCLSVTFKQDVTLDLGDIDPHDTDTMDSTKVSRSLSRC